MNLTVEVQVDREALVQAMVDKLPSAEEGMTTGDQERWLDAMRAILGFLYPPEWSQEARQKAKEARAAEVARSHAPKPFPSHGIDESRLAAKLEEAEAEWEAEQVPAISPPSPEIVEAARRLAAKPAGEEAPSTTSADAVETPPSETPTSGAGDAEPTSPPRHPTEPAAAVSPPKSAPSRPSTVTPAHTVPPPQPGRKRHFNAQEKADILRRIVREGKTAVADDTLIHESSLNRWIREMPRAYQTFEEEYAAEQAQAEASPSVAELEAEKARPIPDRPPAEESKPVQWPSTPIERRPVDHERVRQEQADWA